MKQAPSADLDRFPSSRSGGGTVRRQAGMILLCLCLALVVTSPEPTGPEAVVFETSLGPVRYPHPTHVQLSRGDCAGCHHPSEPARQSGKVHQREACRHCHKKRAETLEGDPPSFYEVKMEFCRGCHLRVKKRQRTSKAPTDCEQCHDLRNRGRQGRSGSAD